MVRRFYSVIHLSCQTLDLGENVMNKKSKDSYLKDKKKSNHHANYTVLDDIEFVVTTVCGFVIMSAATYFFMKHS